METIRKDSFYTELIQLGAEYLRAVALSYFLCGITQVYFALLKNTDHTAESSIISSMAVVVNIMLNAVLIFGWLGAPAMGIRGAALATVIDGIFGMGGDAKFDMNTNIVFMWCICVPLSLMAAFWWHLPALVVFCLYNMDEIIKLPVVFIHYRKYIWLRNITREMA